jgi:hypothetical protein
LTKDQYVESPAVVDFLYRNDNYKSVATQIPHDFGFDPKLGPPGIEPAPQH